MCSYAGWEIASAPSSLSMPLATSCQRPGLSKAQEAFWRTWRQCYASCPPRMPIPLLHLLAILDHHPWCFETLSKAMMQSPPGPAYAWMKATTWGPEKHGKAVTRRTAEPWGTHLPSQVTSLAWGNWMPRSYEANQWDLRANARRNLFSKSGEKYIIVKQGCKWDPKLWGKLPAHAIRSYLPWKLLIGLYFLLRFYNSSGNGLFLYSTFPISKAGLWHYIFMLKYTGKGKKFSHYCCFLKSSVPSMPPLLKSYSEVFLADMTPCCHLIRCGAPHGMNKYLSTTAY